MSEQGLLPTALRMLVDILSAAAKIAAAIYGGALILVADALWTLHAWYFELNRRGTADRKSALAAAAGGLVLASAAIGLGWRALGVLLAGYQGLGTESPGAAALTAAVLIAALRESAIRLIERIPAGGAEGPTEIRYERLVSLLALALLAPAVLYVRRAGFLDPLAGLLLAIPTGVGLVRIVYRRIEPFFTVSES